jgi:O-methyltransferase / aklanonic acid methyltransferase
MKTSQYKTEVAATFDRTADSYDQGVEFFSPMGRRLVELAAPPVGGRVLDVGCGRGACVFPAAARVGPSGQVVGIDVAAAMVRELRAEAVRLGADNVTAHVMDAERPEFPAASFESVIGSFSLIFLPDVRTALRRLADLLVPGGRMGFTSPVFTADTFPFLPPVFTDLIPKELLRSLPEQWRPEALTRRFNSWLERVEDVRATVESAGLTKVEVVDEPIPMVAASGESWVDWSRTHGMRLLWDHLAVDDAARLRARLIKALDDMRGTDGRIVIDTPVRFVTAHAAMA